MPLYGILKKYLGEWLDLFVICFLFILGYLGLLTTKILYSSLKVLLFFYMYKIYHIIFVRQYDETKKYAFSGDFDRIFSKEFLKKYKWVIYISFILMPGNLFGYILVTIVVNNKLIKVWFNGIKDLFFFKLFKYDIRPIFERYIIGYYDNIDKYVRIFINEPFIRMIMVPTLVRNSLIHSSFFSILKARMFMFLFVSTLVMTGLIEYVNQPGYIGIIIIYIYFLLIGPIIIKIFNIQYFDYNGILMLYTTPSSIYAAYIIVRGSSVSLHCLLQILIYIKDSYMLIFYIGILPRGYQDMLSMELIDKDGLHDYVNVDRKFAAIMFGRYEKIYTSFICFKVLMKSICLHKLLRYYNALNEGFYGAHIKKEEVEEMKKDLKLYIDTYYFFLYSSVNFLNPKIAFGLYLYLFYRDEQVSKEIKGKGKDMNCENIVFDFFSVNEIIEGEDIEIVLPIDIIGVRRYKKMLRYATFFDMSSNFDFINIDIQKFTSGYYLYIYNTKKLIEEKGFITFNSYWHKMHYSNITFKLTKNGVYKHEVEGLELMESEYKKLYKQAGMDRMLKKEDIEKLLKK